MKIRTILAVTALALVALPMTAAHAASSSANATITASVPESISISFTDAATNFPSLNAGSTTTDPDTFSYSVGTNASVGYHVNVATGATNTFADGVAYIGKTPGGSFTDAVNGTNQAVASNWRTFGGPGTNSYQDSVRIILPADYPAGSYSATLVYTATTN